MRTILLALFVSIATNSIYAQYVSVDTVKLNKAYRNLMASDSRENQEAYFSRLDGIYCYLSILRKQFGE